MGWISIHWSTAKKERNKANLRDWIAATGLVILIKLDSNRWFFSLCDLEIWWMTSKYNREPLLYYIKLCASFKIHRWIQAGVTVHKHSIQVKISNFFSRVTLKFDGWPWKTTNELKRADKVKFTDRQTDGQTQATTIPFQPFEIKAQKFLQFL